MQLITVFSCVLCADDRKSFVPNRAYILRIHVNCSPITFGRIALIDHQPNAVVLSLQTCRSVFGHNIDTHHWTRCRLFALWTQMLNMHVERRTHQKPTTQLAPKTHVRHHWQTNTHIVTQTQRVGVMLFCVSKRASNKRFLLNAKTTNPTSRIVFSATHKMPTSYKHTHTNTLLLAQLNSYATDEMCVRMRCVHQRSYTPQSDIDSRTR